MPELEPVDYGEYTPQKAVTGGTKPWPLSYPQQRAEVMRYLRTTLQAVGCSRTAGLQVIVHWNHVPDSVMRIYDTDFGDGVPRECFSEFTLTGEPIAQDGADRDFQWLKAHVKQLHAAYGIRPHDRPPQAPVPVVN